MLRRGLASAPIHVETLPNGLRLLVRASPAAPVAEVQIWALAGSADEREDEAGLAHFHEHMLFKGTRRRGVGEIAGEVEALATKLIVMVGKKTGKSIAGRMIPGFAIAYNAVANRRDTNRLGKRAVAFYAQRPGLPAAS